MRLSQLATTSLLLAAFAAAPAFGHDDDETPANMLQTAKSFLAALDAGQLARAHFPFQGDERENWHFIPKVRKGLPMRDMTPTQQRLACALLSSGLSARGYIKTMEIMSLEDILKQLENGKGPLRDPENYFFSVFGDPAPSAVWGFRVEGHHVSQNFTLVGDSLAGSPEFFGANPAEIREGPRKGLRVLAGEEDLARALVDSLSPDQRKIAIVSETAYPDIFTMASRQAALEGQPSGLSAAKLNPSQRRLLQNLLEEYAGNVAAPLAAKRREQIRAAGDQIAFAWAGSTAKGQGHYYRIQAPAFLVEYDDTQNGGNHIHSVWRDFHGDFGRDLLLEHYRTAGDHTHH